MPRPVPAPVERRWVGSWRRRGEEGGGGGVCDGQAVQDQELSGCGTTNSRGWEMDAWTSQTQPRTSWEIGQYAFAMTKQAHDMLLCNVGSKPGYPVQQTIINLAHPPQRLPAPGHDPEAPGSPHHHPRCRRSIDQQQPPPPPSPRLLVQHGVPRKPLHLPPRPLRQPKPLRPSPHHVSASQPQQRPIRHPAHYPMPHKPVRNVRQSNVRTVPLHSQRQSAVDKHVRGHRPGEAIPRHGNVAERDGDGGGVAAVALEVLRAPDEAEGDAGADVREDGQADEEGFGERGLVDLAREEEVGFGGGDGARDERDERGRGEVEGCEDGEGVGGVALDAGYWGGEG